MSNKKIKRDIGEQQLLEAAGWQIHECDSHLTVATHKATGRIVELEGDEELDFKLLNLTRFISNQVKNQLDGYGFGL
jgi:hypothetical protein